MSITPSIQGLPPAGRPFTVTLTTDAGFETGTMSVSVDGESRTFRVAPAQELALTQPVTAAPVSPVSVQDWGTAADRGKKVTVSVAPGSDDAKTIA